MTLKSRTMVVSSRRDMYIFFSPDDIETQKPCGDSPCTILNRGRSLPGWSKAAECGAQPRVVWRPISWAFLELEFRYTSLCPSFTQCHQLNYTPQAPRSPTDIYLSTPEMFIIFFNHRHLWFHSSRCCSSRI